MCVHATVAINSTITAIACEFTCRASVNAAWVSGFSTSNGCCVPFNNKARKLLIKHACYVIIGCSIDVCSSHTMAIIAESIPCDSQPTKVVMSPRLML